MHIISRRLGQILRSDIDIQKFCLWSLFSFSHSLTRSYNDLNFKYNSNSKLTSRQYYISPSFSTYTYFHLWILYYLKLKFSNFSYNRYCKGQRVKFLPVKRKWWKQALGIFQRQKGSHRSKCFLELKKFCIFFKWRA